MEQSESSVLSGKGKEIFAGKIKRIPLSIYNEDSKNICKIIYKGDYSSATGFFFYNSFNKGKFIITNYHVIPKTKVESNMIIQIEIYNKKIFELKLNKNERYFKFYEDPLDITIINISDLKDLCHSIRFFQIDLNYMKGYDIYLNSDVFTMGYPFGDTIECSPGKITKVSNDQFEHNCDTNIGSSGSPIILASSLSVIGIHKGGNLSKSINIGTFLGIIYNHKSHKNPSITSNKNIQNNPQNLNSINNNNDPIMINNPSYEANPTFAIPVNPLNNNSINTNFINNYDSQSIKTIPQKYKDNYIVVEYYISESQKILK